MADASLIKKLGIKPKQRLLILNAPEGFSEQIGTLLPAEVELFNAPSPGTDFDIVIQFVRNKSEW